MPGVVWWPDIIIVVRTVVAAHPIWHELLVATSKTLCFGHSKSAKEERERKFHIVENTWEKVCFAGGCFTFLDFGNYEIECIGILQRLQKSFSRCTVGLRENYT